MKIMCNQCNGIVEEKAGDIISCTCKSSIIDSTSKYTRIIGDCMLIDKMTNLEDYIVKLWENINNFAMMAIKEKKTKLSRNHIRYLIQSPKANPTVETLIELSRITGVSIEEITHEYCNRLRNTGARD